MSPSFSDSEISSFGELEAQEIVLPSAKLCCLQENCGGKIFNIHKKVIFE